MPGFDTQKDWAEIRYRVHDPNLYSTCRRKNLTDGVDAVMCKRKDSSAWEIQALRFAKSKFSMAEARKWYADHKDSFQ